MTSFDDLPSVALRLVSRSARPRHILGTNRYAQVCRSWRDAATDTKDEEQLQLLLALEGLPRDSVTSTSAWLAQHGKCVTSLHITYDPETAPLFQQLPLSTAPLVGLARLEVDGPDSLVALAPALPQLVALTHLRACISLASRDGTRQGVFLAQGVPLRAVPCLQQLCPGLRSLHLAINSNIWGTALGDRVDAPVAELLPASLEQLQVTGDHNSTDVKLSCATLTSFTALRRLSILDKVEAEGADLLLHMPAFEQLDFQGLTCSMDGCILMQQWLTSERCTAPQHLTKLTGMSLCCTEQDPMRSDPLRMSGLSSLRKLKMHCWETGAAAWVQQLSGCERLRHLTLHLAEAAEDEAATVVSALSSVQQLTYLRLGAPPASIPGSTWAAVLPHLTQLRVLCVHKALLLEGGLAPELTHLTQLQCLYVWCGWYANDAAVGGVQLAPHLKVLSRCSSLAAVVCWSYERVGYLCTPRLWQRVHKGGLHLSCWQKWGHAALEGRVVCPRPCPHLPGVWELPQPADEQSSD